MLNKVKFIPGRSKKFLLFEKSFWKGGVAFLLMLGTAVFGYYLLSKSNNSVGVSSDFLFFPDDQRAKKTKEPSEMFMEYYTYKDIPSQDYKNNKFGLYIYAENKKFFDLASKLVNSNGGSWGYVLIPYNIKDYDANKWGKVFSLLLEKKLIPIIQLYDVDPSKYKKQTEKAAEFLDSFLWPVKQRYISVYNEPNDEKFWKGYVDAKEYAKILDFTIDEFKAKNSNFFMLNGAFNVSASTGGGYVDSFTFMSQMDVAVPGIFNKLDGWASHSYPQPNFSGSIDTKGRMGIRAYEVELDYLKNELGLEKDLPVFITETGWAHAEGEKYNPAYLSSEQVGNYIKSAYEKYWLPDSRVVAVTPFTIWYPVPFDHFSWVDKKYNPYPQYEIVKSMPKVSGTPQELITKTYRRE